MTAAGREPSPSGPAVYLAVLDAECEFVIPQQLFDALGWRVDDALVIEMIPGGLLVRPAVRHDAGPFQPAPPPATANDD